MYVAADHGNVDILNMLIDAGGDVNIANVVSLGTIHVWHSKADNIIKSKFCGQNCTFAWANLYICMGKPHVHGQHFLVMGKIVCLYLQIVFSWSKLLLCMGKISLRSQTCFHEQSLYLKLQTRYSWSNSTFVFAHISMPMTKRHVLVLASFFIHT